MSTPREVLAAAMYHPTSTDKSLVDAALAALRAAGFEVLPTALVDAVLNLLPWVSLYNKQADALADEIRAWREEQK